MTHTPLRMCVACRKHRPTEELIRVTAGEMGAAADTDGKKTGRGAYICRDAVCVAKARKKHVIERHLKCGVSDALYEQMEEKI